MKTVFALLVALVASTSAFHVAVPPARAVARSSTTTIAAGYVPDGLTPQQYEKIKKEKADAAAKKKKFFKEKKFEELDSFMKGMEKSGRKHTFAKVDDTLEKLMPAGARGVKQSKK
ncbi:unnamed protein product [Sphacelaria rigidula]